MDYPTKIAGLVIADAADHAEMAKAFRRQAAAYRAEAERALAQAERTEQKAAELEASLPKAG